MSAINVINIQINNNPSLFNSPISLSVTFECLKTLSDDLEWKLIYVSSANEELHEQELDSFTIGPLERGIMQFVVETEAPDQSKILQDDILGIAALILSISFKGKEFFRTGYYVHNNYLDETLLENPPSRVKIDAVYRNILSDKSRVTRFSLEDTTIEKKIALEKTINSDSKAEYSYLQPIDKTPNYQEDSDMTLENFSITYMKESNLFPTFNGEASFNPFLGNFN